MIAAEETVASQPEPRSKHLVRHGAMRYIGEFTAPAGLEVGMRSPVIIRTERGLEVGETLCPATPRTVAMIPEPTHGDILRLISKDDSDRITQNREIEAKEFDK